MAVSTGATGLDLRISDAEREAAIDELRRHCAEGRISPDELSERIDAVFTPIRLVVVVGLVVAASVTGAWWLLWLLWPLIHWTNASYRHRRRAISEPRGASLRGAA